MYMCGVVSMYGGVYALAGVHVSGCIWVYMSGYKNVSVCVCGGVACVWGICTRVCVHMCACVGVHAGEPTCSSGVCAPMLVGGRVRAECGSWRGHTLHFPLHSLKTTTVSQCEFFVAKINFLI